VVTPEREVRAPRQQRTRDAWERVLEAGVALLTEGGLDALTVSAVCRRAGISAPSLYARVDGRAGLVAAVYEHVMLRIRASDEAAVRALPDASAPVAVRIEAVVDAAVAQFRDHAALLRPVIAASLQDDLIHRRGVDEARRLIDALSAALALGEEAGRDIATMIFSELVMSTMYGPDFASPFAPDDESLRRRLVRMAAARAGVADAGR